MVQTINRPADSTDRIIDSRGQQMRQALSSIFGTFLLSLAFSPFLQAQCSVSAGESGHDFETHQDYIKNPKVTDQLLVLVSCSEDFYPGGVKIFLAIGDHQCGPFEWEFASGLGYYGTFPQGLQGKATYSVYSSLNEALGSGSFDVFTAKKKQSGCPKSATKCRKKISGLNAKTQARVCKNAVEALRGPIILRPK